MSTWLTVLACGIGCYGLRISMVAALSHRQPSAAFTRTAAFVLPAAFAALAATALLHTAESAATGAGAPVAGAGVTVAVAIRTSSSTTALVAGMATAAVLAATIAPL